MTPEPREKTIQIRDVRIAYDDTGHGRPPLVFVHGLFNTRDMWRSQVRRFAASRRVITYDLRGHGGSDLGRRPFSIELLADDLAALLDRLDAAPAVVCGFSVGGCVAQVLAARRPDQLAGLVISDSVAGRDGGDLLSAAGKGLLGLSSRLLSRRQTVALTTLPTLRMQADVRRYFQATAFDNLQSLSKEQIREVAAALFDFRRQDLSGFDKPALVLVGEREPRFVRRQAQVLRRSIPGAALRVVPEAQHGPNLENPSTFDAALEDLLAETSRVQRAAA